MNCPLSRCAPSPQGDDSLAAGRPLLAVSGDGNGACSGGASSSGATSWNEPKVGYVCFHYS
ncbi:hypothetical protein FSY59_08785 [Comamonas sp. Z3]|nr:hypothetical protein FSY59_08785 [Comamonas sp. Z3]